MSDSKRAEIQEALKARLETITSANGYVTAVQRVFMDNIPMGLDLDEHELPAILVIAGDDNLEHKVGCLHGRWTFELQLWHGEQPDAVMDQFVRDVHKAIYANSPTAKRRDAFRIHTAVYKITTTAIATDLNMIDANRVYGVELLIEYSTQYWDL